MLGFVISATEMHLGAGECFPAWWAALTQDLIPYSLVWPLCSHTRDTQWDSSLADGGVCG